MHKQDVPASGDGGLGVVLGVLGVEDVVATAEALADEVLVTAELVAVPADAELLALLLDPAHWKALSSVAAASDALTAKPNAVSLQSQSQ